MATVKLSSMPDRHKTTALEYNMFNGGLNLRDVPVNLPNNESPRLLNMWWNNGVLQARPGMIYKGGFDYAEMGSNIDVSGTQFHDYTFIHMENRIFWVLYNDATGLFSIQYLSRESGAGTLPVTVDFSHGVFFRFQDHLFFKNRKNFLRIEYTPEKVEYSTAMRFSCYDITDEAFVPTITINASPFTGSGDIYQPENRITGKKRLTYNAESAPDSMTIYAEFTHSDDATEYSVDINNIISLGSAYCLGTSLTYGSNEGQYTFDVNSKRAVFYVHDLTSHLAQGEKFTVTINCRIDQGIIYNLPVRHVDSVDSVIVDGILQEPNVDYTVNLDMGFILFNDAPPVMDPPMNNTVEVVYSKANNEAYNAFMSAPYATICGSGTNMCIVVGGGDVNPDVILWSGNNNVGIDPTYWPMDSYNIVGNDDPITGFGTQYEQLFVFKERSVGKLNLNVETVNERNVLSITYQNVNVEIGCDIPYSIQLIENNLVFANTKGGVFRVLSSSAAYENNIQCVSEKVNGTLNSGLLSDLRNAYYVSSFDDGKRYYLSVIFWDQSRKNTPTGIVWLLDYKASDSGSWFYWSDVRSCAWFSQNYKSFYVDPMNGFLYSADEYALTDILTGTYTAIHKVYEIPPTNFGSYDRMKDVLTAIFAVPSNLQSRITITYESDWETRKDRVDLITKGYTSDEERGINVSRAATIFRRRPMCRHVRHFSMRLENDGLGEGLALLSVSLQARFAGRDR